MRAPARRSSRLALVASLVTLSLMGTARAGQGWKLDSSFGSSGQVAVPHSVPSPFAGVSLQKSGRIVWCGLTNRNGTIGIELEGFLKNGRVDPKFGTRGDVVHFFPNYVPVLSQSTQQPDGKIVAFGGLQLLSNLNSANPAVFRFLPSGEFDPSFGTGGIVTIDSGSYGGQLFGGAVQPDGKIIAIGTGQDQDGWKGLVVRLQANGALDPTFANGGKLLSNLGGDPDSFGSGSPQADGKILLGNASAAGAVVQRLTANGSLDSSFGNGGTVTIPFSGQISGTTVLAVQRDGRVLAAGYVNDGDDTAFVTRLMPDGTSDPSFGTAGVSRGPLHGTPQFLLIQKDGRIIVGGYADGVGFLERFSPAGAPDPSFAPGGTISDGSSPGVVSGTVQHDGRIVLSVYAGPSWTVQRYRK